MSIQIFPLSEGVFTIGADKVFVPFDTQLHNLNERPTGSLLVEIQPFLVRLDNKNILLDTGLGYKNENGILQIHANLSLLGIQAEEIDMVILSHLHKDHAGGVSFENEKGVRQLSFPNAVYYVGKEEFNYGIDHKGLSYVTEDFSILEQSAQTEWLAQNGTIHPSIEYETAGGHCPFHQIFLFHHPEETLFFGGDIAPQLKQLKTKYIAKYDFDGRRSMELRQQYADRGAKEHWTFLFYHDVQIPYAKLGVL